MATVDLVSVSKSYESHLVLNQVDLAIGKGEFVVVVGPSGCGKSTLLRLIAGLDTMTSGRILINGHCVNQLPAAARDMAMVFQNYALYPHMTIFNNMAYGLKMRGMKKPLIRERVVAVAELLQISAILNKKPGALSGGQRQRVAMGRAIVRSPAVFLFDEPLSNLDAKLRTEMRHEIRKLHQQLKTTCLYVTHCQTEAMTMGDKVVVLHQGRIEQSGTPRELYQYPQTLFVASFIGHYPMNFLQGVIDLTRHEIHLTAGVSLPLPPMSSNVTCGDAVVVGVRPEHMVLNEGNVPDALEVTVQMVDDLGADKLLHVITLKGGVSLLIRVPGGTEVSGKPFGVALSRSRINLFCKQTGKRLGGWDD